MKCTYTPLSCLNEVLPVGIYTNTNAIKCLPKDRTGQKWKGTHSRAKTLCEDVIGWPILNRRA